MFILVMNGHHIRRPCGEGTWNPRAAGVFRYWHTFCFYLSLLTMSINGGIMTALIVDDDARLRAVLARWLSKLGCETEVAESAQSTMQKTRKQEYDVVLLDYQMPEHDGLWFMQNAELPRQTVVLLITGHVSNGTVTRMFDCGISGYLAKPFTTADLSRHLGFHTRRQRVAA